MYNKHFSVYPYSIVELIGQVLTHPMAFQRKEKHIPEEKNMEHKGSVLLFVFTLIC